MKHLALSNGRSTLVDDDVFDAVSQYRWRYCGCGRKSGYVARNCRVDGKQVTIYLHREILSAPPGMFVDHINFDTMDNRRENLRLLTVAESNAHRRGWAKPPGKRVNGKQERPDGPSLFGAQFHSHRVNRPWYAVIRIDTHKRRLGSFTPPRPRVRRIDWRMSSNSVKAPICRRFQNSRPPGTLPNGLGSAGSRWRACASHAWHGSTPCALLMASLLSERMAAAILGARGWRGPRSRLPVARQ